MLKQLRRSSLIALLAVASPLAAQLVTFPAINGNESTEPATRRYPGQPGGPPLAKTDPNASSQTTNTPWRSKRLAEWTEKDSWLLLSNSPWAKQTPASLNRLLSQYSRRDGGDFGAQDGGHGGVEPTVPQALFGTGGALRKPGETGPEAQHLRVTIRWESAMPVQAAEFRTHDSSAPELDGEDYAIEVYNVNLKLASLSYDDQKSLNKSLQRLGMLKIDGRAELKPSRVVSILDGSDTANVIYYFPRSAHITKDDTRVEFDGQVGRVVFSQYFFPADMTLLGKLEL